MLNGADAEHASFSDFTPGLVHIRGAFVTAAHDNQAIIAQVVEVLEKCLNRLIFSALEECIILLAELCYDLS